MHLLLFDDLAAFEQFADAGGSFYLTLMRADLVNMWIERFYTAVVCFKRHRSYLVCPVGKPLCLQKRPYCMRTHELCAVEQGQTFL